MSRKRRSTPATRVLVVEDSPTQAAELSLILEGEGFDVTTAGDGAQGLERLEREAFDVVISDVVMPEMTGYELCRRVKLDPRLKEIPFILLTTLADPLNIVNGLECGADNFLTKPYDEAYLIGRVTTILERRRQRTEGKVRLSAEMEFLGSKVTIDSDKEQILDLLLSTFEETVRANRELRAKEAALAAANATVAEYAARLETRIRTSEKRYRNLMEHGSDGIFIVDQEGVILEVNPQAERLLAQPAPQIVGRRYHDLVVPEQRDYAIEQFGVLLCDGAVQTNDIRLRRADGQPLWASISASLTEIDGRPLVLALARDVTRRRLAEEALRQSEERYRAMFGASPLAMWLFDPADLRLLAVNDAAVEQYGYSRDELLSLTLADLRPPEHVEKLLRSLTARGPGERRLDHSIHRRKDGVELNVDVYTQDVQFEGRTLRLALLQDVTEQRRLEQQFEHAQRMEAMGRLAGGVAHDFNNLLTVISWCTEMLIERFPENDPARRQRALSEIAQAASRATDLTRQLLSFSRRQVVVPRDLALDEVVVSAADMLQRLIGEHIELVTALQPDPWPVRAEEGALEQVLVNLVVNARDAMPGGGQITVETRNVVLDGEYARSHVGVEAGQYVLLAVSDTGCGMDEATLRLIFEPFFTTKEPGKGTGLGLSTVYGIARRFGGHIWVYSEPGRGTTFKVYLPRVVGTAAAATTAESTVAPPPQGTETVLLVEDNAPVRALAVEVLRDAGYQVLEAARPALALEVAGSIREPIHLLLTDIVMPGMQGPELARRVRELHPETTPMFMSGYANDAVFQHDVLAEGTIFLEKPFRAADLLRKVREALDARAAPQT